MPIRRINSTGRKKILREDIQVFVHQGSDGVLTFDAILDLAEYELPPNAQVFVEAYRQSTFMRFEYGTVAAPQAPSGSTRRLTEFATKDGLLFRIKVTSIGERPGQLLADGDSIPISSDEQQPDRRIPLLPPLPYELEEEVWRIDFAADGPLLLVNKHVGDWKAVAASPMFRSLVFPSAMRQVLRQVIVIEAIYDDDDPRSWQSRWLSFAQSLGVGNSPAHSAEDVEKLEWIESVVAAFSRNHRFLAHYKDCFAQEMLA